MNTTGQQIDFKTDLMDMLEEMAVNQLGTPIELIQARRSMDYAIEYSMSNSKFFKLVCARQHQVEPFFSRVLTMLYNNEFDKNERLILKLPEPQFLNITNTNQIITNAKDMAQSLTEMEMVDTEDQLEVALFTRELLHYHLGTYLDMNAINAMREKARLEAARLSGGSAAEEPQQ